MRTRPLSETQLDVLRVLKDGGHIRIGGLWCDLQLVGANGVFSGRTVRNGTLQALLRRGLIEQQGKGKQSTYRLTDLGRVLPCPKCGRGSLDDFDTFQDGEPCCQACGFPRPEEDRA